MSLFPFIAAGGAALGLFLNQNAKKNKEKKADEDRWNDDQMDIPAPIIPTLPVIPKPSQTIPRVPDISVPEKVKEYSGKYSASVEVNRSNLGNFNALTTMKALYGAVQTSNVSGIRQIAAALNADRTREIHNQFLELSKGQKTLYYYINGSSLSHLVKMDALNFLTNAGVGKKLVKTRSKL